MIKFSFMYNVWGLFLFVWFCISCITVPLQTTIPMAEKIFGVGTNLLMLGIIWHALFGEPNDDKSFWAIACIMTMIWYGYYTLIDASGITAHSPWISLFYVFIDISSFMYVTLYFVDNIVIPASIKANISNIPALNYLLNIATFSPLKDILNGFRATY